MEGITEFLLAGLRAFLVGGAFCALAQVLIDRTRLTPARILVSYVVAGVVLGAIGWFSPLESFAGCGASVPLLGFGATIARGVREAVGEVGLLGALTGGLTAASAGTAAALCFGYLAALLAKGRPKRM